MFRKLLIFLVVLALIPCWRAGAGPLPQHLKAWGPNSTRPADETSGSLLIVGGGRLTDEIVSRFVQLVGGEQARLVVIPTASSTAAKNDSELIELWQARGVGTVTVVHTRDRAEADSEAFVRPIQEATGVWIGGGQQSRLSETYVGTQTESALLALLARGGTVGGTSAGAAIMSREMIAGGRVEPDLMTGLGLLPEAIVDQHFLKRNRLERLRRAVLRQEALQGGVTVGIGIDESTAIHVSQGEVEVLGQSYVIVIQATDGAVSQLHAFEQGETFSFDSLLAK